MRVAALYDIHGNLPALEAVVRDVRRADVDQVLVGPLVICGHTHMQFNRTVGSIRVVNAGSVGMPFGKRGADWLLLGPDVQLRHTAYDPVKAAEQIQGTTYPQARDFATHNVLRPPSEEHMLEVFARAELKPS